MKFSSVSYNSEPAKTSKKSDKAEIETKGVRKLAAYKLVIDTLMVACAEEETDIKALTKERHIIVSVATKLQSPNYRIAEDGSSALSQLKKKPSNARLSPESKARCIELGIKTREVEEIVATWTLNTKYLPKPLAEGQDPAEHAAEEKAKAKVLKTLESLMTKAVDAGTLPEDIMVPQEGVKYDALDDDALATLCQADHATITQGFDLCAVQALSHVKFDGSIEDAIKVIAADSPVFAAKAEAKAAGAAGKRKKAA